VSCATASRMRRGICASAACRFCEHRHRDRQHVCTNGCVAAFKVRTIGFCGPAGAGKSTAALRLTERWRFARVRFAEPLKAMLRAVGCTDAEVDGEHKERPSALLCGRTPRQAMQWLGTEWGRDLIGPDFWVEAWKAAVERVEPFRLAFSNPKEDVEDLRLVCADDVRFQNEVDAIHAQGGLIVEIRRPEAQSASGSGHKSEQRPFEPDLVIENDGDLRAFLISVDDLAEKLRKKS
jgi:hypothetical protein